MIRIPKALIVKKWNALERQINYAFTERVNFSRFYFHAKMKTRLKGQSDWTKQTRCEQLPQTCLSAKRKQRLLSGYVQALTRKPMLQPDARKCADVTEQKRSRRRNCATLTQAVKIGTYDIRNFGRVHQHLLTAVWVTSKSSQWQLM